MWDNRDFRMAAGILAILVSLGFLRARIVEFADPGRLGFFGNRRYWPSLLHAALYAIFAGLILSDREDLQRMAWIALATDICLGALVVGWAYS